MTERLDTYRNDNWRASLEWDGNDYIVGVSHRWEEGQDRSERYDDLDEATEAYCDECVTLDLET